MKERKEAEKNIIIMYSKICIICKKWTVFFGKQKKIGICELCEGKTTKIREAVRELTEMRKDVKKWRKDTGQIE